MTKYGTYRIFRNKQDLNDIKRVIVTENHDESQKLEKLANDEEWEELDFDPEVTKNDESRSF